VPLKSQLVGSLRQKDLTLKGSLGIIERFCLKGNKNNLKFIKLSEESMARPFVYNSQVVDAKEKFLKKIKSTTPLNT
jgi:hypothetical protein